MYHMKPPLNFPLMNIWLYLWIWLLFVVTSYSNFSYKYELEHNIWIQNHVNRSNLNMFNGAHGIPILFKHLIFVISQIFCSKLNVSHPVFWANCFMWCIKWRFWLFCWDYQIAYIVHQMGWNQSPGICKNFWKKLVFMLLYIGYKVSTPLCLLSFY